MGAEQRSVPLSRQAFLKGIAGVAVAAGTRGLQDIRFPIRRDSSPAVQLPRVTVDLSNATGKTVQSHLYGYATGALLDDDSLLAANKAVDGSAGILAPSLIRFNTPAAAIMQKVFAKGVSRPDWTPFSRWSQHRASLLGKGGRLIFGIGPVGDDTSVSPTIWAEYARATALHFRKIGQEITYWEVGNECDPMGPVVYSRYFNAIADALHSVNRASLVGGPVASWWNGIDLPTFVSHSGTKLGFIDFHHFPVSPADSAQAAYEKAVTFSGVAGARNAVAGTVAANLPIGLLEYNMNPNPQPSGKWGLPAQGTIIGAVFVALLLTQAFESDTRFTMGGLWDLVADSNYGAIGNAQDKNSYHAIDEQGRYLRQATRLMPGQQVTATTTAPGLRVLATRTSRRFSIQFVNYNRRELQTVALDVRGRVAKTPVARWELSAHYPGGRVSTTASPTRVPLPPESIVILTGTP